MEFNQFVDEVKGGIKLFLPREYENAQIRIEEVRKLNENYLGITVLKENQIMAPTFNLNQLYEMYQSNPEVSMESIMKLVREYAPSKVVLAPFMIVAGDHAKNDMAGDDPESWYSQFKEAGYEVEAVIKGLGEYPGIRKILVNHLKAREN